MSRKSPRDGSSCDDRRVWLSAPQLAGDENALVRAALESGWITGAGPHVDELERMLAEVVGVAHAVAVSSGTAALHLALRALGVGAGDPVICSTLTYVASASPILYQGAEPVLVDAEEGSWNLDPRRLVESIERLVASGRRPAAVVCVDLFGQCANYAQIEEICDRYEVPLIEDAAEALGASHGRRAAGSFGLAAVLSFNGNKIITASGGGALVSSDPSIIEHARRLAAHSCDPAPHYQHSELGYNYRMSNVVAAIGCAQLRVLQDRVLQRRTVFERYREGLSDLPGLGFMPEATAGRSNRWLSCITLDPAEAGIEPEKLRQNLGNENIEARRVWKPLHLQPLFADNEVVGGEVAERIFERGLCLPSGPGLTVRDQDRVISIIRSALQDADQP